MSKNDLLEVDSATGEDVVTFDTSGMTSRNGEGDNEDQTEQKTPNSLYI